MRYWKNNFTTLNEFKFFNSWAIKNQRYSEFVEKRYPSYDVPHPSYYVPRPSYDGHPYPSYDGQGTSYDVRGTSYDGFPLYHILIYGCGVKITKDINPIYAGLERSCPRDSKIVSYVDVGLV